MGFGFVEFSDAAAVKTAIKRGNGQTLDGHMIEVKRSDKAVAKGGKPGGAPWRGSAAGSP
jgi:RNA recognition motif-containing protein